MLYSYFPGCTMSTTGIEYAKSLRFVNKAIGMRFADIKGWNCCGASAAHAVSRELGVALPARNIALAEMQRPGVPIVVACAACYSRMKCAENAIHTDREKLRSLTGTNVSGDIPIVSILEAFSSVEVREAIASAITRTLSGLKVACYYGCLFARPSGTSHMDDPEDPTSMDELMALAGAEPVKWSFKTECCGGSHHIDLPAAAKPLSKNIFQNARANGAQAIVTACPMCMMNLDMREGEINRAFSENFNMPVYYFTELLALVMGANEKESGINRHFWPATKLISDSIAERGNL
ncbi:MAG: CoB--CoM heterodisulfide reductase iron-sulfur subunit B family protein [Oscillospiraceae bacterium]